MAVSFRVTPNQSFPYIARKSRAGCFCFFSSCSIFCTTFVRRFFLFLFNVPALYCLFNRACVVADLGRKYVSS